jgi:hypothetical protein
MTNPNPLQRYFRQPAIYIQLPSTGKYYPEGSLHMPPNDELPVYPMTAMDEITYRTADALFNGSAVINVIKSCVPNIVDPWQMPSSDLDAVLVGIRIASYGHELELESKCPSCEEENSFTVDLRAVMEQIKIPDFDKTVQAGDIEIYFKPLSYQQQNENSIRQFEDQKILQAIPDADISEQEKLSLINSALVKLGEMTISAITQSISMIRAGSDIVTDQEHINEFIKNCDRKIYTALRERIISFKEQSTLKPLQVQCTSCEKPYETPFTLDVSNFFGQDS